jgi:hypothetical protein
MRTSAFFFHAVVAALSVAVLAGTATAAQVNQIHYDVVGGSFSGPLSFGPISGGTVDLTPVAGTITTPAYAVPMHIHMVLTGAFGGFSAWVSNQPTFQVTITPNKVAVGTALNQYASFTTGGATYPFWNGPVVLSAGSTLGYAVLSNFVHGIQHGVAVGNEVRSTVSPPAVPAIAWLGRVALFSLMLVACRRGAIAGARNLRRG